MCYQRIRRGNISFASLSVLSVIKPNPDKSKVSNKTEDNYEFLKIKDFSSWKPHPLSRGWKFSENNLDTRNTGTLQIIDDVDVNHKM